MKFKYMTSYFYNIRFFPENFIPVSICIWDPKWYKKLGYINYQPFVPKEYNKETDCENCIKIHKNKDYFDLNCNYLTNYKDYLESIDLNMCLEELKIKAISYINKNKEISQNFDEIVIVFIGYEPPYKKCSERFALAKILGEHLGIEIKEFDKANL